MHQLSRHWGNPRLEVVQDFCTSMVCINPWSHDVPRYPIVCGSKCLMDSVPHRFKLGECSPFQPLDSRALRHSAELGRPCWLQKTNSNTVDQKLTEQRSNRANKGMLHERQRRRQMCGKHTCRNAAPGRGFSLLGLLWRMHEV